MIGNGYKNDPTSQNGAMNGSSSPVIHQQYANGSNPSSNGGGAAAGGVPAMHYFRLAGNEQVDDSLNQTLEQPLLENNDNNNNNNNNPQRGSQETGFDIRHELRSRIRWIGNCLGNFTLLTMAVVVPIVTYRSLKERRADLAAFDSAAVMTVGTVVLSLRLVYLHLTHWHMPDVQKYVVRILWMVPIYSIQSWLSLRFHDARIYIDTLRDLYEAFVIASFVYYLIELLGGQEALVRTLEAKANSSDPHQRSLGQHQFPLNFVLQPWELGMEFMLQCKHGVLQYVVCKAFAAFMIVFFQSIGCYGEGQFKWYLAYPYMAFFLNMSVMYALYCLVMLFHAVNEELRNPVDWGPLGKFLCIKGVVFFTWWQGVLIFYLKSKDIIQDVGSWTGEEVANGLIDYCICIEMVFFAIAHSYTFSYKEYLPSVYRQVSRHSQSNNNENNGGADDIENPDNQDVTEGSDTVAAAAAAAHPPNAPAVLDRPLSFRHAFWSSTVPEDTFKDIRRFRHGIEQVKNQTLNPGVICLQEVNSGSSSNHSNNSTDENNNNNNNNNGAQENNNQNNNNTDGTNNNQPPSQSM